MSDTVPPVAPIDEGNPPENQPAPAGLAKGLRNLLNMHGYGFQHAVLKRCLECGGNFPWREAVSEYAVALNGHETHVEFILGSGTNLIVAECKRVESWRWAFARSGSGGQTTFNQRPRADYLYWIGDPPQRLGREVRLFGPPGRAPYDVCVEMPHGRGGDKQFDHALKQVMLGRGGLMEDLTGAEALRYGGGAIVPVIFTTAPLVTTETELRLADLHTGHLGEIETSEPDWIWFNYNLPRSLRPMAVPYLPLAGAGIPNKTMLVRTTLSQEMTRSVAIVNVKGIEAFFANLRLSLDGEHDPVEPW